LSLRRRYGAGADAKLVFSGQIQQRRNPTWVGEAGVGLFRGGGSKEMLIRANEHAPAAKIWICFTR